MIKITPHVDYEFALQLARSNMAAYYQQHGIVWEEPYFAKFWQESENFGIYQEGQCVGFARLRNEQEVCHLADLQVSTAFQGKGLGAYALGYVLQLAKIRRKARMRLVVFADNPAQSLYQRFGFQVVERAGSLWKMECALAEQ
ncbi:GNAT family N-acetyltransferase [Thiothrix subterranea]|uniref:GNAT family N-acetyltransferase n=1 Tax=Thiothrix subterranea TaxID=2735563 RepID=A0ABU0YDL6_9GAMM|nr:GNAT family N-acetyltransferase [Thiothrix subterranea]MDQ5770316.1 GNAT family N-acetyltransferase [Thiothrix subterranea]